MSAGNAPAAVVPQEPESGLQRLVTNLLTPGSSLTGGMQLVINCIYTMLVLVIGWCIYLDPSNVHFYCMSVLLAGLIVSTNWFFTLVLNDDAELAASAEAAVTPAEEKKNQ